MMMDEPANVLREGMAPPEIPLMVAWPSIARNVAAMLTYYGAWAAVNIVRISKIMWPGDEFHATEIGIGMAVAFFAFAISPMVFGHLSDKLSRIKLLGWTSIAQGAVILLMQVTPEGQGLVAWTVFIGLGTMSNLLSGCVVPIGNSFISDSIPENKLAQVQGLQGMLMGFTMYGMMLLSSVLFAINWRIYLFITCFTLFAVGLLILFKGKEPTRGSMRKELQGALKNGAVYTFTIDRNTVKRIVLSRSNVVMYVEGIFTQIVLGIPNFLLYIYLQSPPNNLSSWSNAMIGLVASLPGNILAMIFIARLSDKYGERNTKNRILLVISGLLLTYFMYSLFVSIPLAPLTPAQGNQLDVVFSKPEYLLITFVWFGATVISGMFGYNQRPLVQSVNIPETQGLAASINTFLEVTGGGIGIMVGGILINLLASNFPLTTWLLCLIGGVGTLLWLICFKCIDSDMKRVSALLDERARKIQPT